MNKLILTYALVLVVALSGCNAVQGMWPQKRKARKTEEKPRIVMVESLELAKVILAPKRHKINIARDPFRPVVMEKTGKSSGMVDMDEEQIIKNMSYLGVVRIGDVYSALLNTQGGKGVYRVNDKINKLTVVEIKDDLVVLRKGEQIYKLKKGVKGVK